MIECRGIVRRFGNFTAVNNVSLEVSSGIFALLGPNGAGKSTLLKILTGMLPPDGGSARICGFEVCGETAARQSLAVRRVIGVLPEDLGLFDSLTIEEHLLLCGPIYGIGARKTRERATALMRVLNLDYARDRFLDQCSHGMRKKTALAMALIHNPRVLFLDEPFEGIDPAASRVIQEILKSISRRGVIVFLTSHILSIVDQLADEIAMIRAGKIEWTSPAGTRDRSLEHVYFELVETPVPEELPWLGSRPS